MADKTITIEELRTQAAQQREAWSKVPVTNILDTILSDLTSPEAKKLVDNLRPLFDALPADEPVKAHVGSLIGVVSGLPVVITQRLEQLKQ